MFKNKKNISEGEYQKALADLTLLEKDKEAIKVIYQNYFSECQNLSDDYAMNIVVFVKRANQAIITDINIKKLQFLEEYQPKYFEDSSFKYLVDLWLSVYLFKKGDSKEELEYLKLLDREKGFLDFKSYVLEKIDELEVNNMLLTEIHNVLTSEEKLLEQKSIFEKKHKKLFRKK